MGQCFDRQKYLDGLLTNEQTEQFETHLRSCDECRVHIEEWREGSDEQEPVRTPRFAPWSDAKKRRKRTAMPAWTSGLRLALGAAVLALLGALLVHKLGAFDDDQSQYTVTDTVLPMVELVKVQGKIDFRTKPSGEQTLIVPAQGQLLADWLGDRIGLAGATRIALEAPTPGARLIRLTSGTLALEVKANAVSVITVELGDDTVTLRAGRILLRRPDSAPAAAFLESGQANVRRRRANPSSLTEGQTTLLGELEAQPASSTADAAQLLRLLE